MQIYDIQEKNLIEEEITKDNPALGEIVLLQCFICIAIALIVIALNIINSSLVSDVIGEFAVMLKEPENLDEIIEKIKNIFYD